MNKISAVWLMNGAMLLAMTGGCVKEDARLVELSEKSAERQAEQNRQIAKQSQKVAEATRTLVDADAKARTQLIAPHRSPSTNSCIPSGAAWIASTNIWKTSDGR